MVCSRLSVLGLLHSSGALTPLSRRPKFTQQHELLCTEERPSSVNTWLSLHVHSHLITGDALISEESQCVREAQGRDELSTEQHTLIGDPMLNRNILILFQKFQTTISQELKMKNNQK